MPLNENVTGPYLCPLTSVEWSSFKPAETWTKSCLLCCKQAVVSGCLVSRWTFLVEGDKVAGRPPRALLLFVGTLLGLNPLQIQCLVAVSGPELKRFIYAGSDIQSYARISACVYLLFVFHAQSSGEYRQTRSRTLDSHPYLDDPFNFNVLFLHA